MLVLTVSMICANFKSLRALLEIELEFSFKRLEQFYYPKVFSEKQEEKNIIAESIHLSLQNLKLLVITHN